MKRLFLSFIFLTISLQAELRDYDDPKYSGVVAFYKENHEKQTFQFVRQKMREYCGTTRTVMSMWEVALRMLNFIDASDPDLQQPQLYHAIQVAEAMRKDGLPEAWIVAGFIHDFGKVLCFFDEPQWAIVGDTFPVGCAFSDKIIFHEFFKNNPDSQNPHLGTPCSIYQPHCGLENVLMSWGHDEYLYQVIKEVPSLSDEIKYAIRFHSFYAHHEHNAYEQLTNDLDKRMLQWVKLLNQYDLYTKIDETFEIKHLLPYYQDLIERFFPEPLNW